MHKNSIFFLNSIFICVNIMNRTLIILPALCVIIILLVIFNIIKTNNKSTIIIPMSILAGVSAIMIYHYT